MMQSSDMQYFPLAWPFLLALFALFLVVLTLVEIGILRHAYERMGVPPRYVFAILLLSLVGSAINIPVARFAPESMVTDRVINFYGVQYVVPVVRHSPGTILAVNVGGALIPVLLSIYLMFKNSLYVRAVLAIAVVAVVTHWLATPVRGVGVSLPIFIPPIVAALAGLIFGWGRAAPLAYIGGCLGTLIGADLMNLSKIPGLGAPVASIGGAGTFDGVFLVGIVAVLLSPATRPQRR
ncbi:MAG TPA: DUF1614 domain-containing protein [Acidobacteriaceae bacterium]|nr:DUF1614 domain-containing protein [Acidobacteriaceae bacterium]